MNRNTIAVLAAVTGGVVIGTYVVTSASLFRRLWPP